MEIALETPWAVHASALSTLRRAAAGERDVDLGGLDKYALDVVATRPVRRNTGTESGASNVAIIPISGTLVKSSAWYLDMQDYSQMVRGAADDNSVLGIVLLMDTPGGQVNGTLGLARTVSEAARRKPVAAVVDGLCASAGYWIASASQRIFCANETVETGSIGVMTSFMDIRPALEKEGVKFHEVYSSLSPDKNRMENDLLKGKYDEYREKVLDPLARLFIQYVQAQRPQVKEEALTGSVYFPAEAIRVGLADQMGGVDEAVDWILGQLDGSASQPGTSSTSKTINMENLENLASVLGNLEMQDGGVFLNQEQLDSLEAALARANASSAEPAPEPAAENPDMVALMERLASMENALQGMESRLANLEKQPAGQGGGAPKDSDFKGKPGNDWAYADNI